jgi:two-component system sensor histidine kinase KdpD
VINAPVLARRLRAAPYLASAGAVLVVGLAAHALTRFVSLPHVSVLFIAAVVMSAAFWGFWPSVLAALLSVAAGSYFFYSPIFSFRVSAEQDLADLAVFVIVAAFTSRLAANVRTQALEARRRRDAIAGLLAFNERLAESASDADLHAAIVAHLAPLLGRPLHLLLPEEGRLRVVASDGGAGDSLSAGRRIELRAAASAPAGVVMAPQPGPPADPEYVKGLLAHAGLALERARLRREVAEARLKAQGEQLREALLNSVSHDLQTPLAAILGSATALESFAEHGTLQARRELVSTIREETERLTAHIENVLDLTRIRSGQIAARLELVELADIINAALRRKESQLRAHDVQVRVPPDLPMLRLDLFLMEHALANLLDNAAKYAPAGSRITLAARMEDEAVALELTDQGCGIAAADLQRVFAAFYRGTGPQGRPAAGTGLGLAICRAFVEANGGSVAALSAGEGRGVTVRVRLPLPAKSVAAESPADDD